jgi:hypothetical protein
MSVWWTVDDLVALIGIIPLKIVVVFTHLTPYLASNNSPWSICYTREESDVQDPSVHEQAVYEFSLIRDAQINTFFFSIYEPILAHTSSFLSHTDRCSRRLFSGSNGKLIFVLRVFALRAVLEERKPRDSWIWNMRNILWKSNIHLCSNAVSW